MTVLPFGGAADIRYSAVVMGLLAVVVGLVYIFIASFHEDGLPDQPLLRCSEVRAVGGLQDMTPQYYMPPDKFKQDVAGYARSFVGLAGTSAAIATAMALISLLARKNMA